jgi:hypothetical protein
MFKLEPNPTFWAKVQLSIPGQEQPVEIEVEFKHLGREGLKGYYDALGKKTSAEGLAEIVMNWRGVDAEFSRESLEKLLANYPAAAGEFYDTFRRELLESKAKN